MIDIIFGVLTVLIIVIVLAVVAGTTSSAIETRKVKRFFEEHSCTTGVVLEYEYVGEKTDTFYAPVTMGDSMIMVPYTDGQPEEYWIVVKCVDSESEFLAAYRIPKEDYKAERIGSTVSIKKNWEPIGYTEISDSADPV